MPGVSASGPPTFTAVIDAGTSNAGSGMRVAVTTIVGNERGFDPDAEVDDCAGASKGSATATAHSAAAMARARLGCPLFLIGRADPIQHAVANRADTSGSASLVIEAVAQSNEPTARRTGSDEQSRGARSRGVDQPSRRIEDVVTQLATDEISMVQDVLHLREQGQSRCRMPMQVQIQQRIAGYRTVYVLVVLVADRVLVRIRTQVAAERPRGREVVLRGQVEHPARNTRQAITLAHLDHAAIGAGVVNGPLLERGAVGRLDETVVRLPLQPSRLAPDPEIHALAQRSWHICEIAP